MDAQTIYRQWLADPLVDDDTKRELQAIAGDAQEIEERFYQHLQFGTAGLRGVLGAGTNRINIYTVRRATQGLANYIIGQGVEACARGVVIAYDSRRQSPELSFAAAATLVANGIRAYLFTALRPTPELSFAVRYLGATAGIVVTASHNPPEYNGYKVYWEDGAQINGALAAAISAQIAGVEDNAAIRTLDRAAVEASDLFQWIDRELDDAYMARLRELVLNPEVIRRMADSFRIVYTPLHGAGNESVQRILREVGFTQVFPVPEQEQPDGEFPTVKYPNPEEREAFACALAHAERIGGTDLIVGTDPDADRVGVIVQNSSGEYEVLNGNQTGALLVHYLLSERAKRGMIPANGAILKTVVTSELGRVIAQSFGVETVETLTGFKYIGEKMREFEASGAHTFLFGYEESYGYLAGTFVRDKDAVMITMLICEMAAFYKDRGQTLYEAMQALYREYGYFKEHQSSLTKKGIDGLAQIRALIAKWREEPLPDLNGQSIVLQQDYLAGQATDLRSGAMTEIRLPRENMLAFTLEDGSWFCMRPSGTEPKLKLYFAVQGRTEAESDEKLQRLVEAVSARVNG